jgi:hypothetical protein
VEPKDGGYWDVADADGNWKGSFDTAADARAFVALPALIALLQEAATDEYGDVSRYLGWDWLTNVRAALAQADGPAPKE